MIKRISILAVLILFCAIPLVGAETQIGDLYDSYSSTTSFNFNGVQLNGAVRFDSIVVKTIQNFVGISQIKRTDVLGISAFDSGAPTTASTSVTGKVGTTTIFTGTIGYVRDFSGGTEGYGYQYLLIDYFNNSHSKTGNVYINLTYDHSKIYNLTFYGIGNREYTDVPAGWGAFGSSSTPGAGQFEEIKAFETKSHYEITKPSGVGIEGTVSKTNGTNVYSSRIFIKKFLGNSTLVSEAALSSTDFSFNILNESSIYVQMLTPTGRYINSSTFFTGISPITYIQTQLYAIDGNTGAKIVGATLAVKDTTTGTWTNGTSSVAGLTVSTPYGDLLDIYGTYPGVYTASSELSAVAGGDYYLPMYPPVSAASFGYTNVFINVQDSSTNNIIQDAMVTFRLPSGATTGESTGASGTARFTSPNNTVLIIGLSKSGYTSTSQSISVDNTGADVQHTIKMSRATVTTVPTITNTYGTVITTVPTIDSRTDAQKDSAMMGQLREAGPGIISLCILGIIFGIIKMIMK